MIRNLKKQLFNMLKIIKIYFISYLLFLISLTINVL